MIDATMVENIMQMGRLEERGRILDGVTAVFNIKGASITAQDLLSVIGGESAYGEETRPLTSDA